MYRRNWKNYFKKVYEIKADLENGKIKEYAPQKRYKGYKESRLHRYGNGRFCHFHIDAEHAKGIYVLTVDGNPYYVGRCVDLYKRFNSGYGNISPRKCYEGGQQTNCRINKNILNELKNGRRILLYFYKNQNIKNMEIEFIFKLGTKEHWNK